MILRIRIFVNRKILILRILLRKMTILRKILRIRIFVNTGAGPVFTKILRIFFRITLKSKKKFFAKNFLILRKNPIHRIILRIERKCMQFLEFFLD